MSTLDNVPLFIQSSSEPLEVAESSSLPTPSPSPSPELRTRIAAKTKAPTEAEKYRAYSKSVSPDKYLNLKHFKRSWSTGSSVTKDIRRDFCCNVCWYICIVIVWLPSDVGPWWYGSISTSSNNGKIYNKSDTWSPRNILLELKGCADVISDNDVSRW